MTKVVTRISFSIEMQRLSAITKVATRASYSIVMQRLLTDDKSGH